MDVRVRLWGKLSAEELMLFNYGVGEDSWESLGLQGDPTSPFQMRSVLGVHWKDWCWSWNSNTLATWCEEMTHLKRLWCWERLRAGGEGDDRGWDGWMASPARWTWVCVDSGSWWWTGRPGVLRFMGSQRVRHDWVTELNWTELNWMTYHTLKWPWNLGADTIQHKLSSATNMLQILDKQNHHFSSIFTCCFLKNWNSQKCHNRFGENWAKKQNQNS